MLEALEQSNLFLGPLDGVGLWYRYHALFATAMQTQARHRFGEAHIQALIERAGNWYEAHDMIGEAIDAAFAVNNVLRAADLMNTTVEHEFSLEARQAQTPPEFHRIEFWLAQLPQTIVDERPMLSLAAATSRLFAIMVELRPFDSSEDVEIERGLQNAERGLQTGDQTDWLSQIYAIRALLHLEQGRLTPAAQWANLALGLLPAYEMMWHSFCLSIIGQVEEFVGHLDSAADRFAEALSLCEQMNNRPFARVHSLALGSVYVQQNKLHQAETLFTRLLNEAKTAGDIEDMSRAFCGLAEIALDWNDLDTAWSRAAETVGITRPQTSGYVDAVLILTRVELARGEHDAARIHCETLLASRLAAKTLPEQQIRARIAYLQAAIALSAGDLNAVRRWREHRLSDAELSRIRLEAEETLLARLLLAENRSSDAVLRLEPLLTDAEHEGRERSVLEMQVCLAQAYAANHQQSHASHVLMAALTNARPANARRVFIDAGTPISGLLHTTLSMLEDKTVTAFARAILRAIPKDIALPAEPLSQQERRVLSLIADGRGNAEIAVELVVSVNTVKAHVKNIYRKLRVSNRIEATKAAGDFGLL